MVHIVSSAKPEDDDGKKYRTEGLRSANPEKKIDGRSTEQEWAEDKEG